MLPHANFVQTDHLSYSLATSEVQFSSSGDTHAGTWRESNTDDTYRNKKHSKRIYAQDDRQRTGFARAKVLTTLYYF